MSKTKYLPVMAFDKHSSASFFSTLVIDDKLQESFKEWLKEIPFTRYYIEYDNFGLTKKDKEFVKGIIDDN